jgi:hypothetical protein
VSDAKDVHVTLDAGAIERMVNEAVERRFDGRDRAIEGMAAEVTVLRKLIGAAYEEDCGLTVWHPKDDKTLNALRRALDVTGVEVFHDHLRWPDRCSCSNPEACVGPCPLDLESAPEMPSLGAETGTPAAFLTLAGVVVGVLISRARIAHREGRLALHLMRGQRIANYTPPTSAELSADGSGS